MALSISNFVRPGISPGDSILPGKQLSIKGYPDTLAKIRGVSPKSYGFKIFHLDILKKSYRLLKYFHQVLES